MSAKPIPEGYQQAIPYLVVPDATAQMDFLLKVFDGTEINRMMAPDGSVVHGEVKIGDSVIMIGQAREESQARKTMVYLYMENCDTYFERAKEFGASVVSELEDQFYGDRHGAVEDSNGNHWYIVSQKEIVSPEELQKRTEQMMQGG